MSEYDDETMRNLPVGNDDFKVIRGEDRFYVDKTMLIEGIVKNAGTQVFLFTRPRRFGKSVNMSMLDAFFNLKYQGNTWFDGLHVETCDECMEMMNKYPVMSVNLKGLNTDNMECFLSSFGNRISELFKQYRYVLDSDLDEADLIYFNRMRNAQGSKTDLERSLKFLTDILKEHHGKDAIVLIDEYDNPVQETYGRPIQDEIISFMRNLLTNVLKSNQSLKFGVVTGVMQIAKESVFSGLNNLSVDNIFSRGFDSCFGFTESEIKDMLEYYEHPEKFDECREWYDGYTFGDTGVYNPWSLINYVKNGFVPRPYWAGTSGNSIIDTLLQTDDEKVWNDLNALAGGKSVTVDMDQSVVYSDLEDNIGAIYSVMAMSGYLRAKETEDGYEVSIPNREMYGVYSTMILRSMPQNSIAMHIRNLFRVLQNGDTAAIGEKIHDLMKDTISSKVLDSEHAYQAYLIGMMMGFCGNYEIYGDRLESGDGFADIIFRKRKGPGANIVIELKKSRSEDDLQKDAERAMQQIIDRDYMHGLDGRCLLYGISFFSKEPCIVSRVYN